MYCMLLLCYILFYIGRAPLLSPYNDIYCYLPKKCLRIQKILIKEQKEGVFEERCSWIKLLTLEDMSICTKLLAGWFYSRAIFLLHLTPRQYFSWTCLCIHVHTHVYVRAHTHTHTHVCLYGLLYEVVMGVIAIRLLDKPINWSMKWRTNSLTLLVMWINEKARKVDLTSRMFLIQIQLICWLFFCWKKGHFKEICPWTLSLG